MTFLEANEYEMTCTEMEETERVLRVAAGEMSEGEWAEWVGKNVARM